jgi:two-component system phosphate regulon sensor histidine kinase PhoR
MKQYTGRIARGEYDNVERLHTGDELEELSAALSDMSQTLKRNIEEITEQNSRLKAVFRAVPGGILAIDSQEMVTMVNPAAEEMFSIKGKPEGRHFLEVVKHAKLEAVIREALSGRVPVEREITLHRGMEERFLQVFVVPVVSENAAFGAILLAQDITRIRKLENMRSEFAANVSHELKTPLTVISGFIDTLKDPDISRKDTERFLEIISLESERLTRLIDDVLALSEIESAALPAVIVDARQGVREAVELLQHSALDKQIALTVELSKNRIPVAGDNDRIKQMMINLIDNAIKYTPSGGSVHVSVARETEQCVIHVRDTGIGIPQENIPRLFERFYRVDKSRSRAMGGTGLGLAIVKHIVSLLGGHITVQSEVCKGTQFEILLPVGKRDI